jgi:hypothetical protein
MTIIQYNQLPEDQQFLQLEKRGVLVATREQTYRTVLLYQVDDFYVEVYNHKHFNVAVDVKTFTGTDGLDVYLQSINIEDLFCSQHR